MVYWPLQTPKKIRKYKYCIEKQDVLKLEFYIHL